MKHSPNEKRPCQSELGRAGGCASRLQPAIPRWVAPLQSPTPFHWLAARRQQRQRRMARSVSFVSSCSLSSCFPDYDLVITDYREVGDWRWTAELVPKQAKIARRTGL